MIFDAVIPSTKNINLRIAVECMLRQAQIKSLNDLKCLHRDPETGVIHTDNASSTGLYRLPGWFS